MASDGWFEGGRGVSQKAAAAAGKANSGGGGCGDGSSRGGSNASSMEVLPPHFNLGSEAASPPMSPQLQQDNFLPQTGHAITDRALFSSGFQNCNLQNGGFQDGTLKTCSAHLRDPQPDSLQAQLRALHHLPQLPPQVTAPATAVTEPQQQQQWPPQQWPPQQWQQQLQSPSLQATHAQQQQQQWQPPPPQSPLRLNGHACNGSAAVSLPPDSWLSPKRAGSAAAGVHVKPEPPHIKASSPAKETAAVSAPPSPERPHREPSGSPQVRSYALRRLPVDGSVGRSAGCCRRACWFTATAMLSQ